MKPILHLPADPHMTGLVRQCANVVYSTAQGQPITATILQPWDHQTGALPAIVFVQGSAWTFPDIHYELPQLAWYTRHGYVVMTVTHRNRNEGHPYPAFLQDVKCAIRFLRENAEKYHVDPARVAVWGTSSGGNTAMLVQLTGDDPEFKTEEYAAQSDSVCCAVECFGPADMVTLGKRPVRSEMIKTLSGDREPEQVARDMSPFYRVQDGKAYPPILMLHGDADEAVPYEGQALPMLRRYEEAGVDAQLICVDGAPHEGPFWSWQVHEKILAFLDEHLKQ